MVIRARAPLRLGLAGGGTDVSPYCNIHGGYVLNATIHRYAYAVIRPLSGSQLKFTASDLQFSIETTVDSPLELNGELNLHKAVYLYMINNFNREKPIPMELSTFCDAPAGSGLGSSSTLVVVMIKAFVELLNLPLDDYEIAHIAFRIERIECNLKGGRQDQYAATFGGFNFMEFYDEERAVINSLRIKSWIINELEASMILFYTGVSRESAKIIEDQSQSVKKGPIALEAMHGIKKEALIMKESLLKGDFKSLVESMLQGWEDKKKSSKTVSNPFIDEIYTSAISSGALCGKVSGAGGGGFMLFFVPSENRMNLVRTLKKFDGEISNCHFTNQGCQAWKVYT